MNDKVKVTLVSGKGGDGAIAFRREKCVEAGGPYGGNGGKGGSIFIKSSSSVDTLADYRFGKTIKAEPGENGRTKLQFGKDAKDITLYVPIGTVIEDEEGHVLKDLYHEGDTYLAVKGGRGGRGNAMFKNARLKTPNFAENGLPGQEKTFYFELKLLGDVGLVGYPNVGKSSFLSAVTRANPQVADYPFTTLEPMVGVCFVNVDKRFVVADIPGLIDGASQGRGLGTQFLRHIERCRVLLHILDVTKDTSLNEDFEKINHELDEYSSKMKDKIMVVGLNKIDEDYDKEKVDAFKKSLEGKYEVFSFSTKTGVGLKPLIKRLYTLVSQAKLKDLKNSEPDGSEEKVYSAKAMDNGKIPEYQIVRIDEHTFEIKGERVVRTYHLINTKTDEGIDRLLGYLDRIGIDERLKEAGAHTGDTVILDDYEFDYYE